MKPTHNKDQCNSCKYLETTYDPADKGNTIDWYSCNTTLLGQYGDEISQYGSSPFDVISSWNGPSLHNSEYIRVVIHIAKKYELIPSE
jgi:hypothetical protein